MVTKYAALSLTGILLATFPSQSVFSSEVSSVQSENPVLFGEMPKTQNAYDISYQEIANQIWEFVKQTTRLSKDVDATEIYFKHFGKQNLDDPDMLWLKRWFNEHTDSRDVPRERSSGWHYTKTNKIQINPSIYERLDKNPNLDLGKTNHVVGHEMIHYVLEQLGSNGENEHCMMVFYGYENKLIGFLREKEWGG